MYVIDEEDTFWMSIGETVANPQRSLYMNSAVFEGYLIKMVYVACTCNMYFQSFELPLTFSLLP